MTRLFLVFLFACGSSSSRPATHDAPPASDAPADALVPVPTYAATPDEVLLPPNGHGTGYGRVIALSADGLTLATFDQGALYAFTRANSGAAFPNAPNIAFQPPGLSSIGYGVALSADGSLLVCSAVTTGNQLEILVYTRQGTTYGTSPQVLAMPSEPLGILMTAMSPDATEIAYDDANDDVSILARAGSGFSNTPSQTIPKPAAASASGTLFASTGSLSASGSTMAIGDPGSNGVGAVFVYTGGTTPAQTLTPTSSGGNFGTSVAVRSDAVELVEGTAFDAGEVGVFKRDSSGYSRIQTVPPPTGAATSFGLSVALASDGTLVATDNSGYIYIFAPH